MPPHMLSHDIAVEVLPYIDGNIFTNDPKKVFCGKYTDKSQQSATEHYSTPVIDFVSHLVWIVVVIHHGKQIFNDECSKNG